MLALDLVADEFTDGFGGSHLGERTARHVDGGQQHCVWLTDDARFVVSTP